MNPRILVVFLGLVACSKDPEPQPEPDKPAAAKPAAKRAPEVITWEAPANWTKVENASSLRKASYKVPRVEGDSEDGDLAVSQAGGSIDANIKRWSGQFEPAPTSFKREERRVGELEVTIVEATGGYVGWGPPGTRSAPKAGQALLGAVVKTGKTAWFFKLTGPEKTVKAARADFDKLVSTFKPAAPSP